jgi:hypothetical protein
MAKPLNQNLDPSRTSVYAQLMATNSPVAGTLKKVERAMPRPQDSACLLMVLSQIRLSVQVAMGLLVDHNEIALKLLQDLDNLQEACSLSYKERGISDSYATLARQLTPYRGWATLALFSDIKAPLDGGRLAALGMEIALKWIVTTGNPRVADAHTRDLATGRPDLDITAKEMLQQIHHKFLDLEDLPKWFKRAERNYHKFCQSFQIAPPPPPPKPTFEEIANARYRALVAHPAYRLRAAILDNTCLNIFHLANLFDGKVDTPHEPDLLEVLLWLSGFSGLAFQWIKDTPLASPTLVNWRAFIDLEAGILWRDFIGIAPDSAKPIRQSQTVPASYSAPLPLPKDVLAFLRVRALQNTKAKTVGDLLPELADIASTHSIFKSRNAMKPTWARWVRTTGCYLRQAGIDSLLVSILTGNFGHCAKSKIYYCAVSSEEIWKASMTAYKLLRFAPPAPMPTGLVAFGSSVVPTLESVREYDFHFVAHMEGLRVMGKATPTQVVEFHNAYVRALAFRLMCLLGLRSCTAFDLLAWIDEALDDTVIINDKTTGDKPGGLPVIICDHVRLLLDLYRKHCIALRARLDGKESCGQICDWLDEVINYKNAPLLCRISLSGKPIALGSTDVINDDIALAIDFGRKVIENWTRQNGAFTRDTDRMLRHEVLGQGSNNSAADHTEACWVQRLLPVMNRLADEVFPTQIHGLRSK